MMEIFSPMLLALMGILSLIVSVMALVLAAYVWTVRRQDRQIIDEYEHNVLVQFKVLERRLKTVEKERDSLKAKLEEAAAEPDIELVELLARLLGRTEDGDEAAADGAATGGGQREIADGITEDDLARKRAAREAEKKRRGLGTGNEAIWQTFLDDYNHLADSVDVPLAEKACEDFCEQNGLRLLICTDHAAVVNGQNLPKFENAGTFSGGKYWAWPITGQPGDYAVVPNPLLAIDAQANDEGGIKETFATNFEASEAPYHHIQVRLPALFRLEQERWIIDQPGVLKLS